MAEPYRRLVLVIDDAPQARDAVATILADVGFRCVTATDAEEALSRAAVVRIDVILLALELPRREHGIALARRFRSMPSACPIVAMTALDAMDAAAVRRFSRQTG